ncbi:MAG: hypothetical protein IPL89_18230 [Acidobacteria bacterium]|nr:hypothetical protein [Acidobacteriota bacterium]
MKAARALPARDQRAGGLLFAGSRDVLHRLLIALTFALALRPAVLAGQPEGPPKPTLQLGGLSEPEVMEFLLPGYEAPPEPAHDPQAEPEWNVTRAKVFEAIETDLGLLKGRYLLAIVNGSTGACAQCGFTIVGIIDLTRSLLVWKVEPDHYWGHGLELLRLRPGDSQLAFAFQWDRGAHEHNSYGMKAIYRPRRTEAGGVDCDLVWSDLVSSRAGLGANGVMWHSRCASMTPGPRAREWTYRRRTFFGVAANEEEYDTEDEDPEFSNMPCESDWGGIVEIRRKELWVVQRESGVMSRVSTRSERVDRAPSSTFPLSLPVRSDTWVRVKPQLTGLTGLERSVNSPNGRFRIRLSDSPSTENEVILTTREGQVVRSLKGWKTDFFIGEVEALGWAKDESRFFAVLTFEYERALLSFSVEGTDDYWEEVLDPYDTSWHDGFVMRPRGVRPK